MRPCDLDFHGAHKSLLTSVAVGNLSCSYHLLLAFFPAAVLPAVVILIYCFSLGPVREALINPSNAQWSSYAAMYLSWLEL